jgi:peptide/nickel transport system ATP-binding protein
LVEHTSGHLAACLHTELMPTAAASAPIRTFPRLETPTLLEVETLRLTHGLGHRLTVAVHDASFVVRQREIVALVGESGSGKTTTARAVVGLHRPAAGRIRFNGEDLSIAKSRTREQRRRVQIVFQNPYSSLQPTREVGAAVIDAARFLRKLDRPAARVEAEAMWDLVRLPRRLFRAMPAQLSGGERQRVAIARALVASPELVVCDEITSALDASVQASVLQLLLGLRDELGLSLLFITHDLGVVASLADWVVVLDSGRICEAGPVDAVLNDPQMPYTQQLIAAAPSLNAHDRSTPGTSLGGPSLTNRRSQA